MLLPSQSIKTAAIFFSFGRVFIMSIYNTSGVTSKVFSGNSFCNFRKVCVCVS